MAESEQTRQTRKALRRALAAAPNELRAVEAWITTFFPYQREWLLDWSRFALLNKARQIGASHTYAGSATLWGLFGEATTVISIGERESTEVLDKAHRHARVLHQLGSDWAKPVSRSATQVRLASGGRILALPSTSGGRSHSANVILDEVAYHVHPEQVWDGAAAVVLHGYRMRALSTPNGVGNFWHNLFTNPRAHPGYRLHEVTIDQAKADGLRVNDVECWQMARGDTRVYDQLFHCSFIDAEQQYIPTAAVSACSSDDCYAWDGDYFAGLDIGRSNDLTALVVVRQRSDGKVVLAALHTCKRTEQEDIDRLVEYAFRRYDVRRLCVDSTGLGTFPTATLQRRYGQHRVEPVAFTLNTKEGLATTLWRYFVDSLIEIPAHDGAVKDLEVGAAEALRQDVCSLRRVVTTAGNVRYDAPQTAEGHADRAWALALALHGLARRPGGKIVTADGDQAA